MRGPGAKRVWRFPLALAVIAAGAIGGSLATAPIGASGRAGAAEPMAIADGERIALVGATFLEREQRSGRIETLFTLLNPGVAFHLRNFAWSADTVRGDSRASFDTAKEGYARLLAAVGEFKPTLVVVGYGWNESWKGDVGMTEFRSGLDRVLDDLTKNGAALALLSPTPMENLGPPLPNPAAANKNLKLYSDALAAEAAERGAPYLDIFARPAGGKSEAPAPLTDDGVHPTEYGYWRMADAVARAVGFEPERLGVEADFAAGSFKPIGGEAAVAFEHAAVASNNKSEGAKSEGAVGASAGAKKPAFRARFRVLPRPGSPDPRPGDAEINRLASRRIVARGLAAGTHILKIDGKEAARADAAAWAKGVDVAAGPEAEQVEALRRKIVQKNQLFFHRWRPENETYLFGFRKHEQGQNAVEIPRFDPLVEAADAEIAKLAAPAFHDYEFTPVAEAAR